MAILVHDAEGASAPRCDVDPGEARPEHLELAARVREAGQGAHELALAVALDPGDADDLARAHVEVDRAFAAEGEAPHAEANLGVLRDLGAMGTREAARRPSRRA